MSSPTVVDTRPREDIDVFENPPAGFDPLLFQIEDLDPIRSNRATTRLFRLEPYDPVGIQVGSFVLFLGRHRIGVMMRAAAVDFTMTRLVGVRIGKRVFDDGCLLFDGNIQPVVWDFVFTDQQARAVSVSSQAVPESLRAVYDASPLADEIVSGQRN